MDPITYVVDKCKSFGTATKNFIDSVVHRQEKSARRSPIEILKRLQREAFSDLMRLRDRQDKVERALSFYNTQNGSPFQENTTHVKGEVDLLGALLMMSVNDNHSSNSLCRAGICIHSRLTFETTVRQKDSLVAEFVTNQKGNDYFGDGSASTLALAKVSYKAIVKDWMSAILIPIGARCGDVAVIVNPSHQEKGLTDISPFGPPLLDQPIGSAIGLTVRKANITASLGQSISTAQHSFDQIQRHIGTFGQLVWQLPRGTKLSLLSLLQTPKLYTQQDNLGGIAIPFYFRNRHESPDTIVEPPGRRIVMTAGEEAKRGFIALLLESELDEVTRIGGWVEISSSNPKYMRWAVSMLDNGEDSLGWGMSLSGMTGGPSARDHFQVESYVKVNMGNKLSLKPGIAYATEGNGRTMAFTVRSNWSL